MPSEKPGGFEEVAAPSGVSFTMFGPRWADRAPFWEARVELLSHAVDGKNVQAARNVYVAANAIDLAAGYPGVAHKRTHLPGTILIRCRINRVTLRFGQHTPVSYTGRETATFLVQADPHDWTSPLNLNLARIDHVVCIAGLFPLASFVGDGLPAPLAAALREVFPDPRQVGQLLASSSGLILDGRAKMPDRDTAFTSVAPYLVEVEVPPPVGIDGSLGTSDGTLIVRVDSERLAAQQFQAGARELQSYFSDLVARLNPVQNATSELRWLRLELTDPTRLPEFHWRVPPTSSVNPVLAFASGEWKFFLSDQPLRVATTPTRGVLVGTPEVTVEASRLVAQASLTGPQGKGLAEYHAKKDTTWAETVTLKQVRFGYDAVSVAARLRQMYDLPTPRADELLDSSAGSLLTGTGSEPRLRDGKIDPPVLWGFTPLNDGRAQLPFFNLTEQLYVDALPRPSHEEATSTDSRSLLLGGAVFGTDRTELFDREEGVVPWNVALLDADSYRGEWKLEPKTKLLAEIKLTLNNPEVTAEGLFWLTTEAPRASDALGPFDDWVTGLTGVALRTPQPGNPYPSPFEVAVEELTFQRANSTSGFARADLTNWAWTYENAEKFHRGSVTKSELVKVESTLPTDTTLYTLEAPLSVWLTALLRSRFPAGRIWGVPETSAPPSPKVTGIAWRRHPSHPCIQALPLTQSATPPNFPNSSRQLAPFDLPAEKVEKTFTAKTETGQVLEVATTRYQPKAWKFRGGTGRRWPEAVTTAPCPTWAESSRLPMVSLGLPGLALAAQGANLIPDPSKFLTRLLYRHDLPVLDQPNALAEVPRETSPVASPISPPVLLRNDYARHWASLEDRAVLAETDEAEAVRVNDSGITVRGLLEPLEWAVKLEADTSGYPGALKFSDASAPSRQIVLSGDSPQTDALRGFEGSFTIQDQKLLLAAPDTTGPVRIVGGTFTTFIEGTDSNRQLRDQRGLSRSGTRRASDLLLTTKLNLTVKKKAEVTLCTRTRAAVLTISESQSWQFWFKDLAAIWGKDQATIGSEAFQFVRKDTRSEARRGVNDPSATSRDYGALNGYEWRVADSANSGEAWLPLGDLRFYPLTIETVTVEGDGDVSRVEMLGRLQLPAWNNKSGLASDWAKQEYVNLDSAVILTFKNGKLEQVRRALPDADHGAEEPKASSACWPLVDREDNTDAPVLLWDEIKLDDGSIVLPKEHFILAYTRQGVVWTLKPKTNLAFPLGTSNSESVTFDTAYSPSVVAGVKKVKLTINFEKKWTEVNADWIFHIGKPSELLVVVKIQDRLLWSSDANSLQASLTHANAPEIPLSATDARIDLNSQAIQFSWQALKEVADAKLQVLPGFHLKPDKTACSGFGMLVFNVQVRADRPADATDQTVHIPQITLRGGYLDVIFACQWGPALQDADAASSADSITQATFNSSAGTVIAEYTSGTAEATGGEFEWRSDLALSGLVEVKNLITWPMALDIGANNAVTIPKLDTNPLSHWRHTARILLSEHRPPPRTLQGCPAIDCFLMLADTPQGTVWTFPATVEHQLVAVTVQEEQSEKKGDETVPKDATGVNEDREIVEPKLKVTKLSGQRRWVATQQVRLCAPKAIYEFVRLTNQTLAVDSGSTLVGDWWQLEVRWTANKGLERFDFLEALGVFRYGSPDPLPFDDTELKKIGNAMIVEASVPVFLRQAPSTSVGAVPLFPVPDGTVQSQLAALADYGSNPQGDAGQWVIVELPFLGRLQGQQVDTATPLLACDPVRSAARARGAGRPLPDLVRAFTHWANTDPITYRISPFDRAQLRAFRRLDPSSVAEAWFRLNQVRALASASGSVTPSPLLSGVYASAPSDALAVLARPAALSRLIDPRRATLPPRELPGQPIPPVHESEFVWTPQAIKTFQTTLVPGDKPGPYSFLGFPLAFLGTGFLTPDSLSVNRHAAATLIPTTAGPIEVAIQEKDGTSKTEKRLTLQPVSLALSPFVAIGFRLWGGGDRTLLIAVGELVAFDTDGRRAVQVADRIVQPYQIQQSASSLEEILKAWGRNVHLRLAADSPVGIVRVRKLIGVGNEGVDVEFLFLQPDLESVRPVLSKRASAIRTVPERIWYPQGQFSGTKLPRALQVGGEPPPDFALAPPLVRSVQPIRRDTRPKTPFADAPPWPWGISALRLSMAYRRRPAKPSGHDVGSTGARVISADTTASLWWQGLRLPVQFAVPADRQLLPKSFRTRALPGYLPTVPKAPLPSVTKLTNTQAVFPGSRRVLITGLRPGVPFALRETLTTQVLTKSDNATWLNNHHDMIVSGSVPVQHRSPRPILIPKNQIGRQDIALRTWGSWFDLVLVDEAVGLGVAAATVLLLEQAARKTHTTVRISSSPSTEFFWIRPSGTGVGLRVTLRPPTAKEIEDHVLLSEQPQRTKQAALTSSGGELGANWDRWLSFHTEYLPRESSTGTWSVTVTVAVGEQTFTYVEDQSRPTGPNIKWYRPTDKTEDDKVKDWFSSVRHGTTVRVEVTTSQPKLDGDPFTILGSRQVDTFTARVVKADFPSVFAPRYHTFEDPEYNRQLSSLTARTERIVTAQGGKATYTLALVADRREYNPNSKIVFAFSTLPVPNPKGPVVKGTSDFSFYLFDPKTGVETDTGYDVLKDLDINTVPPLKSCDLNVLQNGLTLRPGHVFRIKIAAKITTTVQQVTDVQTTNLSLDLAIVSEPVTPVPDAGYALIRRSTLADQSTDECVRFAWAPDATRIELINPDDLLGQVVRRRAVFVWSDTLRREKAPVVNYGIQKIATTGSTYFPSLKE